MWWESFTIFRHFIDKKIYRLMEKTISRSLNNEKNCWLQPYEWSHTRLIDDQKCILVLNCDYLQGCSQAVNPCLKTKRKCGTWSVPKNSADEYDIEQNAMKIKQSRCRHPDLVLKLYTDFPSQISYRVFFDRCLCSVLSVHDRCRVKVQPWGEKMINW